MPRPTKGCLILFTSYPKRKSFTAKADVMDQQVIYARPTEDVAQVLGRIVHHNVKEIPVVDEERRIIANLSLLDLWNLAGR